MDIFEKIKHAKPVSREALKRTADFMNEAMKDVDRRFKINQSRSWERAGKIMISGL